MNFLWFICACEWRVVRVSLSPTSTIDEWRANVNDTVDDRRSEQTHVFDTRYENRKKKQHRKSSVRKLWLIDELNATSKTIRQFSPPTNNFHKIIEMNFPIFIFSFLPNGCDERTNAHNSSHLSAYGKRCILSRAQHNYYVTFNGTSNGNAECIRIIWARNEKPQRLDWSMEYAKHVLIEIQPTIIHIYE